MGRQLDALGIRRRANDLSWNLRYQPQTRLPQPTARVMVFVRAADGRYGVGLN